MIEIDDHAITNLWTNGETGDKGISIVEINHTNCYFVDNGNCTPTGINFARYWAGCRSSGRGDYSLDDIRLMYGSQRVTPEYQPSRAPLATA